MCVCILKLSSYFTYRVLNNKVRAIYSISTAIKNTLKPLQTVSPNGKDGFDIYIYIYIYISNCHSLRILIFILLHQYFFHCYIHYIPCGCSF